MTFEDYPVNPNSPVGVKEACALSYQHLGLEGPAYLVTIQRVDRDGMVDTLDYGQIQAIFVGTADEIAGIYPAIAAMWNRGHALQLPDWIRAEVGLPPEADDDSSASGAEGEG